MVREIELSEELWRTRFLIELCYLDDRKIVWCVKYVLVKFERDQGFEHSSAMEDV